jgi:hypothetical protein
MTGSNSTHPVMHAVLMGPPRKFSGALEVQSWTLRLCGDAGACLYCTPVVCATSNVFEGLDMRKEWCSSPHPLSC